MKSMVDGLPEVIRLKKEMIAMAQSTEQDGGTGAGRAEGSETRGKKVKRKELTGRRKTRRDETVAVKLRELVRTKTLPSA